MRVSKRTWRIIWAIALKDIADAIRNKTALGIMIGVGFLMLSTQALAFLVKGQSEPAAVIYDQGASAQIHALVRSRTLRLGIADSFEEMVGLVSQSVEPRLGLVMQPALAPIRLMRPGAAPVDLAQGAGSGCW